MIHNINKYIGKQVVVTAGTMTYKGILKSIEEDSVQLKGLTGWIEVPTGKISSIKAADEKEGLASKKFIDQSFYNASGNSSNNKK